MFKRKEQNVAHEMLNEWLVTLENDFKKSMSLTYIALCGLSSYAFKIIINSKPQWGSAAKIVQNNSLVVGLRWDESRDRRNHGETWQRCMKDTRCVELEQWKIPLI